MKIAIIGFGREGQSLHQYLKSKKSYKKAAFWILDKNKDLIIPRGVKKVLGSDYLENLDQFDLIFRSPGVPYNIIAKKFKNWKLEIRNLKLQKIISATKLFFALCPCPIIGITGTKGKTTTSTLIYQILKNCGWNAYLAGNVGEPALNVLPKLNKESLVVLEMSSFQLQDLEQSPHIAVILEMFPDHQDSHSSFEEYFEAKSRIALNQKPENRIFYFADNKYSQKIAALSKGEKISINDKVFSPFSNKDLLIPGRHNLRNALMAFSVAQSLRCPSDKILETIRHFRGVEHRLEFVAKIGGVSFYNDSASTNPGTTAVAVRSFKEPKVLIVGGKDKNLSYEDWPKIFSKNKVKSVIIYGENKNKIKKALVKVKKIDIKICSDLPGCVSLAKKIAPQCGAGIVLFSPGAASFDMFRDYAERGQQFKKLVDRSLF